MKNFSLNAKKEALDNALRSYNFNEKYFILPYGQHTGKNTNYHIYCIASKNSIGGIDTHTKFYSYTEMNSFLRGYMTAITKPLK